MIKNIFKILTPVLILVTLLLIYLLFNKDGFVSAWGNGTQSIYDIACLIFIVINIITIKLSIEYFRANKSRQHLLTTCFLLILSTLGSIVIYLSTGRYLGEGMPEVCLQAGQSVGCKAYYNEGFSNKIVQWCESYYVISTQLDLDGGNINNPTDIKKITSKAIAAGYQIPAVTKDVDYQDISNTDNTSYNPARLCINPSKGGYTPI